MEVDNAGFEIFRSTDAGSYELIASYKTNNELTGLGQSNMGKEYRYIDNSHLQDGQTYYYKLVDVSRSGNRKEHPVKWIKVSDPGLFSQHVRLTGITPNPAAGNLKYSFELKKDSNVSVELYTLSGQMITAPIQHIFYQAGGYNQEIVTGKLSAGTYLLQLKTPDGNDIRRFVIVGR